MSPVQLHTSSAHNDLVLDNTVATQNFEYKMSNILDKPLYSLLEFLLSRSCNGILRPTTMLVMKVRCKSTFSVKQRYSHPFVSLSKKRPWHFTGTTVMVADYLTGDSVCEERMRCECDGPSFLVRTGAETGWIIDSSRILG